MQINLMEILNQDKEFDKRIFDIPVTTIQFGNDQAEIKEGVHLEIDLTKSGENKVLLQGWVQTVLLLACNRCNECSAYPLKSDFCKEVEMNSEDEDIYIKDNVLNIEELALNEIFLNFPMKILCNEDCKGICVVCGCNRNKEECHCEQVTGDIRFAGLKNLFDKNFKEV